MTDFWEDTESDELLKGLVSKREQRALEAIWEGAKRGLHMSEIYGSQMPLKYKELFARVLTQVFVELRSKGYFEKPGKGLKKPKHAQEK